MFISKKIQVGKNDYFIGGEGKDIYEAIKDFDMVKSVHSVFKCGICGSDKLAFNCHETEKEGYKYTTVRCTEKECGGFLNIGENKKTHQRYYRKTADGELDWKQLQKK